MSERPPPIDTDIDPEAANAVIEIMPPSCSASRQTSAETEATEAEATAVRVPTYHVVRAPIRRMPASARAIVCACVMVLLAVVAFAIARGR